MNLKERERAARLAEFYQAVADGKQLQFLHPNKGWEDTTSLPLLNSVMSSWRIKPELKPVDLSVLIESGIDCEFSDLLGFNEPDIDQLAHISNPVYMGKNHTCKYCRPRMNHLHAWTGGDCPLPIGIKAKVALRDGNSYTVVSENGSRWANRGAGDDIIAFEVLGLQDRYCWPWETS